MIQLQSVLRVYQLRIYEAQYLSFEDALRFLNASSEDAAEMISQSFFTDTPSELLDRFKRNDLGFEQYEALREEVIGGANYGFVGPDEGEPIGGAGLEPAYCSHFYVTSQR